MRWLTFSSSPSWDEHESDPGKREVEILTPEVDFEIHFVTTFSKHFL
jgi:hypothetical protein